MISMSTLDGSALPVGMLVLQLRSSAEARWPSNDGDGKKSADYMLYKVEGS